MRAILILITIAFVGVLLCTAVLLLASGRTFVYSPGMVTARSLGHAIQWGANVFGAGLVVGALLQVLAHAYPKFYYAIQWWRDIALGVALLAALVVAGGYLGRALIYGAF